MKPLGWIMLLFLGMGIAAGGATAGPAAPAPPPLPPEGIRVVPPDAGLPPDIRDFSGSWAGVWFDPDHPESGVREILVVEEIAARDRVNVILSWGDCPVCRSPADWGRFSGKILYLCVNWKSLPGPLSQVDSDSLGGRKVLVFGYPEGRTFLFVADGEQLLGTDGYGSIKMKRLH